MSSVNIGITLDKNVLSDIDKIRGLVPRATYINFVLSEHIKTKKVAKQSRENSTR